MCLRKVALDHTNEQEHDVHKSTLKPDGTKSSWICFYAYSEVWYIGELV